MGFQNAFNHPEIGALLQALRGKRVSFSLRACKPGISIYLSAVNSRYTTSTKLGILNPVCSWLQSLNKFLGL